MANGAAGEEDEYPGQDDEQRPQRPEAARQPSQIVGQQEYAQADETERGELVATLPGGRRFELTVAVSGRGGLHGRGL
jgi:hypothetical protein